MGKKKAPKPPNPYQVASAQGAADRGTAEYNRLMNMVDQEGPDGSLDYVRDGFDSYVDPVSKQTVKVPRYKAVTTLSSGQQVIKDASDAAKANNARTAQSLSGKLSGTPLDLDTGVEDWLFGLGRKRLDPRLKEMRATAETDAINRGIRPGSDAYDRLMRGVGEAENDAYNQLALTGRGQAVNEVMSKRRFDIDEILGLMGGAPVGSPNAGFVPVAQTNTPGVDLAGLINSNYQSKLDAWNTKQAAMKEMVGGLFGLAGKYYQYR